MALARAPNCLHFFLVKLAKGFQQVPPLILASPGVEVKNSESVLA